ncbi:MAG: helix-turn-helix domain-containing protein, partial [Clostridiales bacterium]|nr:helix-turn-helix domain-containing protein [Clostridiales bacterium]
MAVFRVDKTQNYTVMSKLHLRNESLTLKAKGLLSQMLSLPEEWDYTLVGLSHINRERIDAIREAVKELERAGYVTRLHVRDSKGRMTGTEYVIREAPRVEPDEPPSPTLDYPTQLSKEGTIKERLSKDPSMGLKGKESSLQREILHEMTRRPKL